MGRMHEDGKGERRKKEQDKISFQVIARLLVVHFPRYVLQGSRWRVTDLTYRVTKYPTTTRLKKSEVKTQIKQRK